MNAQAQAERAAATRLAGPSKLLVGLIGAGIQKSLSPAMHEEEARARGLRLHYQLIDLDRTPEGAAALPTLLRSARTMGFAGLNITYPCKQAVIPLLDELSDEAAAMGAVNTVVLRDGRAGTRIAAKAQIVSAHCSKISCFCQIVNFTDFYLCFEHFYLILGKSNQTYAY